MQIHSLEGFQKLVQENEDRLIILKCKAKGCRPCKVRFAYLVPMGCKLCRFVTKDVS